MIKSSTKVGIWGYGIVGKAAYAYCLQHTQQIQILDNKPLSANDAAELANNNTPVFNQTKLITFLAYNDYIIPSPGIDLGPYSNYAHKWISELDLFAQAYKNPVIAITGTIGKTSTTHLLGQLLQAAGTNTAVGGNIGIGMLNLLEQPSDQALLELSSFQLELSRHFAPQLAIITNLYPNHLDRHGTEQNYFNAKYQLIAHQASTQHALVPLTLLPKMRERKPRSTLSFFCTTEPTAAQRALLTSDEGLYYSNEQGFHCLISNNHTLLLPHTALPPISYPENWLIICAALHILQLPLSIITQHAATLSLPQHRLEKVATINDVTFYNDSKSTTPEATLAAVQQLRHKPIHLLLGGVSKGIDKTDLIKNLAGTVVHIYCFGKEAQQLLALCNQFGVPATAYATVDEAVAETTKNMRPGDQILFSPAGASYDLFKDYMHRGDYFKKLVQQLV